MVSAGSCAKVSMEPRTPRPMPSSVPPLPVAKPGAAPSVSPRMALRMSSLKTAIGRPFCAPLPKRVGPPPVHGSP